jgi:hypothetical protein
LTVPARSKKPAVKSKSSAQDFVEKRLPPEPPAIFSYTMVTA